MSGPKICPQCATEYDLDQRFCPKDGTTLRLQNATGDLVGTIVADRYHVLRKLGGGGMGQVYLAEHVKMGRRSALKVMNPSMMKRTRVASTIRTSPTFTTSGRRLTGSSIWRWSSSTGRR